MAEANFEKINSSQRLRSQSNWAVNYYVDCRKESARDKNHNFTTPNVKKGDVQALKDLGAASPHLEMFLWRHWGLNLKKKHPTKRTSLNAFALFYDLLRIESESGSMMSKMISWMNPLSERESNHAMPLTCLNLTDFSWMSCSLSGP